MGETTTTEINTRIPDSDTDPFILDEIYSDASSAFVFQPETLISIKENAIIFLDANVLLLPYQTGKNSLKSIRKIYEELGEKGRLLIPARVAQEFMKNSPDRLKDAFKNISTQRDISVKREKFPLLDGLNEYEEFLRERTELSEKIVKFQKAVGKVSDLFKEWHHDDPLRKMYSEIFDKSQIVNIKSFDKEAFQKDLAWRYSNKIPPGYKDSGKSDGGTGDLLIWKTILQIGEEKKCNAIFVCGEEKSDWWHRSDNQPIVVRHELVEEYRKMSDGKTFRLINFPNFLELFGAGSEIVEEVRKEQRVIASQSASQMMRLEPHYAIAEEAVEDWVLRHYEGHFSRSTQFADFEVIGLFGLILFEVKVIGNGINASRRVRELRSHAEAIREKGVEFFKFTVILVANGRESSFFVNNQFSGKELPEWFDVKTGYLDQDGKFRLTASLNVRDF